MGVLTLTVVLGFIKLKQSWYRVVISNVFQTITLHQKLVGVNNNSPWTRTKDYNFDYEDCNFDNAETRCYNNKNEVLTKSMF